MPGNNGEMQMSSMNKDHGTNNHYSLVDMTEYQSARALSKKASDIFYGKLKALIVNENYTTSFVSNLEDALNLLDSSIASKASPTDIMMIAHTQIHPNLLSIFNLQTRDR